MTDQRYTITTGAPVPMGPTLTPEGVNFAVFSAHATRIELCLFSDDGRREIQRLSLPERRGDIWFGFVPGLKEGTQYGLRAHGPYRPDEGHRFNPHKLLVDPYARQLTGLPVWDDALMGYTVGSGGSDLTLDTRDSVNFVPRSVVTQLPEGPGPSERPNTPLDRTVIYEAHTKGLTQRRNGLVSAGHFAALAAPEMIDHYHRLGITAVELLPVQAFLTDGFLQARGLTNYWGYQTLGFFAPDTRYLTQQSIGEFRQMTRALHAAGLEVILDVVYNHTGEGDQLGPTLSFRGLDNASYYHLAPNRRFYVDDTGTGNTLNLGHPMVLRMVMDSLRYWVRHMGVDGFRFDLAPALARCPARKGAVDMNGSFLKAVQQDPVLSSVKLIAEPWDIGPGGYQLGAFPSVFSEWNDRYRDGARQFWRGDTAKAADIAARLMGSAGEFDHSGRPATSSINMLTAHDGFTLEDLVSYVAKHNQANGEDNHDGHGENHSDNFGEEGPTTNPARRAARDARKRAMLATLLLSQGVPMLLAGDELGQTQGGNNNAYAQDNETAWIDWANADTALVAFTARLIAFRRDHPILRQSLFLHSQDRATDGRPDLFWWHEEGRAMQTADWQDPGRRLVAAELRMAHGTPRDADSEDALFLVLNAGGATDLRLPPAPPGQTWSRAIDSAAPDAPAVSLPGRAARVAGQAVVAFTLVPAAP